MIIYRNFAQEKETETRKSEAQGWTSDTFDPGIRKFLIDLNRLPFAYSYDMSCSGLCRDHFKERKTWGESPPRNLNLNYLVGSSGAGTWFSVSCNTDNPRTAPFLRELLEEGLDFGETTMKEEERFRQKEKIPSWLIDPFPLLNLITGATRIRDYDGVKDTMVRARISLPTRGRYFESVMPIPAKEYDKLKEEQITAFHNVVLNHLKR